MEEILAFMIVVIGGVAAFTILGFLFAFPTMWLVNYLFSASFLQYVFGISSLSVMKAWALNVVAGLLFKSKSK